MIVQHVSSMRPLLARHTGFGLGPAGQAVLHSVDHHRPASASPPGSLQGTIGRTRAVLYVRPGNGGNRVPRDPLRDEQGEVQ